MRRRGYEERRSGIKAGEWEKVFGHVDDDIVFLNDLLQTTVKDYQVKLKKDSTSQNILRDLNWDIVEILELLQLAADCKDTLKTSKNHNQLKPDRMTYLRKLYKKRCGPAATHVLVIMLSDERRNTKPYALPIQFIPYHTLTREDIRRLTQAIKKKMVELGMECVGKYKYTLLRHLIR